jgi:WD40 repeat protein/tRNA A-37 threonylcarbamoyl transferase component Bud32
MGVVFTCRNGHRWLAHPSATGADRQTLCPACQEPAHVETPPTRSLRTEDLVDHEGATLPAPDPSDEKTLASRDAGDLGRVSIPGYEILKELGHGGMGVVYKARQIQLNRLVALKMILAGRHAGRMALTRFRTEAEAIARLHHPNIVQIYEIGECEGLPFFSLEFCGGGSLDTKLAGTPLPPEEAARLVEAVARAMHVAHQAHVLHRDLKPANILLADDGTPKVTDFGLAKKLDEEGQTAANAVLGTPSYMSPEQANGNAAAMGPHTDVYALGAILYECLTGRPPFRAANPMDTLVQVSRVEPVPPAQLNARVPRDLEIICLKCLQKDPSRRYGSALALADDLRRFAAGEPILARPVGALERGWRWCRRNPSLAALTAAVFVLLAVVAIVASIGYVGTQQALRQEAEQRREAQRLQSQAEQERTEAEHQRGLARSETDRARRLLYDADMELAGQTWEGPTGTALAVRNLLLAHMPAPDMPDLREFTWHYQWRLLHEGLIPLGSRPGKGLQGAFTADGSLLTLDPHGQLRQWDLVSRKSTLVMDLATGNGVTAELSADGKTVAVVGDNGMVRLLDAATGRTRHRLEPAGTGRALAGMPGDGRTVLTRDSDGSVRVWDTASGRLLETVRDAGRLFDDVAVLSQDGTLLGERTGPGRNWLRIIDWRTQKEVATIRHKWTLGALTFSPDGKLLALSDVHGHVFLWDAGKRQETGQRLQADAARVSHLAFAADGHTLAAGGQEGVVTLWAIDQPEAIGRFKDHPSAIAFLSFSPDGKALASGGAEGAVRIRPIADANQEREWLQPAVVHSLAYSPDGKLLAIAAGAATLLRDAGTGKLIHTLRFLPQNRGPVMQVAFAPDGRTLVTGAAGRRIVQWDVAAGTMIRLLHDRTAKEADLPQGALGAVTFSPDGRFVAAGFGYPYMHSRGQPEKVAVWDAGSGKELAMFVAHTNTIPCVSFSPDSQTLATASHDGTVKLWKAGSWDEIRTLRGPAMMKCVAFSPDGSLLAAGAHNGTLILWEVASGRQLSEVKAHDHFISSVLFTRDGKTLVTASADRLVKLWDPVSGRELRVLRGHDDSVWCAAFCAERHTLATGGEDQKVLLWQAATPEEVAGQIGEFTPPPRP